MVAMSSSSRKQSNISCGGSGGRCLLRYVQIGIGCFGCFYLYWFYYRVIETSSQQMLSQGTTLGEQSQQTAERRDQQFEGAIAGETTEKTPVATIGYAVSITGCGKDPFTEGAAVLKHSIHLASVHGPLGGKYDYQMYAIYHPDAAPCASSLVDLGYEILERDTLVAVKDIQGEFLRSKIESNGCCGEKELIKLEAYTITQHPIVVHLDLDVLVLKPLDSLFDAMLSQPGDALSLDPSTTELQWPKAPTPDVINAFFTRDYNMVHPGRKYKPVQGGFIVLRPDMSVYSELKEIVHKGDFRQNSGWGGIGGTFYGSMTFQGIMPYYYDILHPGQAVELNRCVYNQMCDNPRDQRTIDDIVHGVCRTGEEDCEDCRSRRLEDVITTHFTLCQKPWHCLPHTQNMIQHRLCQKLFTEWYRIRADLEESWGRPASGPHNYNKEIFHGYCSKSGHGGYNLIGKPYGKVATIQ